MCNPPDLDASPELPRVSLDALERAVVVLLAGGASVSEAATYLRIDLLETARLVRGLRHKYCASSTAAAVQAAIDDGHLALGD